VSKTTTIEELHKMVEAHLRRHENEFSLPAFEAARESRRRYAKHCAESTLSFWVSQILEATERVYGTSVCAPNASSDYEFAILYAEALGQLLGEPFHVVPKKRFPGIVDTHVHWI